MCTNNSLVHRSIILVECVHLFQRNRLAWPQRRRGLASDGVRYAGARSSVGRRFRGVAKLRLEMVGSFVLLQQRSKHPREMARTPKGLTQSVTGVTTASSGKSARHSSDSRV